MVKIFLNGWYLLIYQSNYISVTGKDTTNPLYLLVKSKSSL